MKTPMEAATQQFRLVIDSAPPITPLALPAGVSFLHAPLDAAPQLHTVSPEFSDDLLILEPIVTAQRQRRLLVLNPAGGLLQVKGHPVPRVAVLAEADEFTLNYGSTCHVTLFNQRHVGPPDAALLGKQCPICRVAFTPRAVVYHCPCGGGVHLESTEEEVGTLDCVPLCEDGLCPVCHKQPIAMRDGYGWFPELFHE